MPNSTASNLSTKVGEADELARQLRAAEAELRDYQALVAEQDQLLAKVWPWVERFDRRPIEPFELLHIRIPVKFYQNSEKLSKFFRNSENSKTYQHFLECSAKSRDNHQNLIRIR